MIIVLTCRSVQLQDEWMKEATKAANRLSSTLCHSITAACLTPKDAQVRSPN